MYRRYFLNFQKPLQWLHFKADFYTAETSRLITPAPYKIAIFPSKRQMTIEVSICSHFMRFSNVTVQKNHKKIVKSGTNDYGIALSVIAAAAIFWRAAEIFRCAQCERREDRFESDDTLVFF